MSIDITIRPETADDVASIEQVTIEAFRTLEISQGTEQFIIRALRADGAMTISLVAELDGRVVGHVAFSPVTVSDGREGWFGLGPVSVLPELHRRGIGSALIGEGLARLRELGARGCCLVGDPAYYNRLGFANIPGFVHEGVPQQYFLALPLGDENPQGTVTFHDAFHATGPQEA